MQQGRGISHFQKIHSLALRERHFPLTQALTTCSANGNFASFINKRQKQRQDFVYCFSYKCFNLILLFISVQVIATTSCIGMWIPRSTMFSDFTAAVYVLSAHRVEAFLNPSYFTLTITSPEQYIQFYYLNIRIISFIEITPFPSFVMWGESC